MPPTPTPCHATPVYSVSTIVLLPDLCNNYKLKQCCSRNNRKIIDSHSTTRRADQGSTPTTNASTTAATTNTTAACIALESVALTPPGTPCTDKHHPEQRNLPSPPRVEHAELETKPISRSRGRGSYKKRRKRKKWVVKVLFQCGKQTNLAKTQTKPFTCRTVS